MQNKTRQRYKPNLQIYQQSQFRIYIVGSISGAVRNRPTLWLASAHPGMVAHFANYVVNAYRIAVNL